MIQLPFFGNGDYYVEGFFISNDTVIFDYKIWGKMVG